MVMRPLAIILMIVWHSFIIYTGGWQAPIEHEDICAYWWIAKLSYAFMLELFVFISGYVFAITINKENTTFKSILISKLRRLIIPSIIFSALYFALLGNKDNSVYSIVYGLFNGNGHFWFLPMLFWTTLLCYIFDKVEMKILTKIVILFSLPALSILPFPLRIGSAFYYIPFFYAGILLYQCRLDYINKISAKHILLLGFIFGMLFFAKCYTDTILSTYEKYSDNLILRATIVEICKYIRFVTAFAGIAFVYATTNFFIIHKGKNIPLWLQDFNEQCFGVYVFQQFVLQILYYKTSLPSIIGPYWLPWIGLVIALSSSYLLSKLVRSFKLGRAIL